MNMQKQKSKKIKVILTTITLIILLLIGTFFWYVSDYYKAEDIAFKVLEDNNITIKDNLTILSPDSPSDTAIIFYPGAKVETEAYLPLLNQIREIGVNCILVDMPFHMAIFDSNAASEIMAQYPEIKHWYMAGHSMGGAMASKYAANHQNQIEGVILLGAYIYGNYPLEKTITIYGTLDGLAADDINYTTNVVAIEGGNHAQFGNYGFQKKDLPATISWQEQQQKTVEAIQDFIRQ